MSVSSNDSFIDPADVELEADEFTAAIDEKKEEIQELKDELEAEDAIDEQVELESKIAAAEDELQDIEIDAIDILGLHEQCEHYARGSTLINESEFQQYCEEFAYDCGEISRDGSMATYIDWERYAEDCKMDYSTITFQAVEFYVHG